MTCAHDPKGTIREIAEDIYTVRGVGISDSQFFRWATAYTHWLDSWNEIGLGATEDILRDVRQTMGAMA